MEKPPSSPKHTASSAVLAPYSARQSQRHAAALHNCRVQRRSRDRAHFQDSATVPRIVTAQPQGRRMQAQVPLHHHRDAPRPSIGPPPAVKPRDSTTASARIAFYAQPRGPETSQPRPRLPLIRSPSATTKHMHCAALHQQSRTHLCHSGILPVSRSSTVLPRILRVDRARHSFGLHPLPFQ